MARGPGAPGVGPCPAPLGAPGRQHAVRAERTCRRRVRSVGTRWRGRCLGCQQFAVELAECEAAVDLVRAQRDDAVGIGGRRRTYRSAVRT